MKTTTKNTIIKTQKKGKSYLMPKAFSKLTTKDSKSLNTLVKVQRKASHEKGQALKATLPRTPSNKVLKVNKATHQPKTGKSPLKAQMKKHK